MAVPSALITGGSSGIGLALSKLLIEKGYHVYSVSRNPKRGPSSDQFTPLEFDLLQTEKISDFAQSFCKEHGVPDLLVNNAGCGAFFEWANFPESEIRNQINLLCTAPILMCRSFAPLMSTQTKGTIVNLSSLATLYPLPFMPLYNAGKSALSSFTESMMLEYFDFPKFIDFRMGDVRTEFNQSASKEKNEHRSQNSSNAWNQIEKQLNDSISPQVAAQQIWQTLEKNRSGTFQGGTLFHSRFLVFASRLLPSVLRTKFIKLWYGITY
jgi:short-subunit dehydrogenase